MMDAIRALVSRIRLFQSAPFCGHETFVKQPILCHETIAGETCARLWRALGYDMPVVSLTTWS